MKRGWFRRVCALLVCVALLFAGDALPLRGSGAVDAFSPAAGQDRSGPGGSSRTAVAEALAGDGNETLPAGALLPEDAGQSGAPDEAPEDALPGAEAGELPPAFPEEAAPGSSAAAQEEPPENSPSDAEGDGAEGEEERAQAALAEALAPWLAELSPGAEEDDYHRALRIYGGLMEKLEPGSTEDAPEAWKTGSAAPQAYAQLLAAALQAEGIACRIVSGGDSAWNIACLDGAWVHIDAFPDDCPGGYGLHFGLNDAAMARDHAWEGEFPSCTGLAQSYLVREESYLPYLGDAEELRAQLREAVRQRREELLLLDGKGEEDIAALLSALLAEIDDGVRGEVTVEACRVRLQLHYEEAGSGDPLLPMAEAIVPQEKQLVLGVGESAPLSYTLLPQGAQAAVRYACEPEGIVEVDAAGQVVGKQSGTASVTLTARPDVACSIAVTVRSAPQSLEIVAERSTLYVGESMQLGFRLPPDTAGNVRLRISAGAEFAALGEDGTLTGIAPGTVRVRAEAYNGTAAETDIAVEEDTLLLRPMPETLALYPKQRWQPQWQSAAGAAGGITFISSDEGIVSVDAVSGELTAHEQLGEALITAEGEGGEHGELRVTVAPRPTSLQLTAPRKRIGVAEQLQLAPVFGGSDSTAYPLQYSSAKAGIASVDAQGRVTAKKVGTVTITARLPGENIRGRISITVVKAPASLRIEPAELTLGVGEEAQLQAQITKGAATALQWESSDAQIATVDEQGKVTGVGVGEASVTATTHNGKTASCAVHVAAAPTAITLTLPEEMGKGQTIRPAYVLEPEGSHSTPLCEVVEGDALRINAKGKLVAVKLGTAKLRVSTHVPGVYAEQTIQVLPAPKSVSFDREEYLVSIEDTLQLTPVVKPAGALASGLQYEIKKPGCFEINAEDGTVTPLKRGKSKVTVTTYNGKSATATIRVFDPTYPEEVTLRPEPPTYLKVDKKYTPTLTVFPETADPMLTWTSSDEQAATVDAQTGKVKAISYGRVQISAKSAVNPKLTLKYSLIVLSEERWLRMPEHRTGTGAISSTRDDIHKVRQSAYNELEALVKKGWIPASEGAARKAAVTRAFNMYDFPWMTRTREPYWRAANSVGGHKDFKPGIVYYGMPYTQSNRRFNVAKLLKGGYYKYSGNGYFLMQGQKFSSRNYPGNDCSSFVSHALWGGNSSRRNDTTGMIAGASYYTTLSGNYWKDLRPGDLLCAGGSHVVMFLYYANKKHTQMVIIEQGGASDPYINCISTSIRNNSYYSDKGFKIRRVKGLNTTCHKPEEQ